PGVMLAAAENSEVLAGKTKRAGREHREIGGCRASRWCLCEREGNIEAARDAMHRQRTGENPPCPAPRHLFALKRDRRKFVDIEEIIRAKMLVAVRPSGIDAL